EALDDDLQNAKVKQFYQNVFLNMNYETEKTFMASQMNKDVEHHVARILELIDRKHLNFTSKEDLTQMVHITMMIMIHNIVLKYAKESSTASILENFEHQMRLLKQGFVK